MEDTTWISYKKIRTMTIIPFSLKKKEIFFVEYSQADSIAFLPQLNSDRPTMGKVFHWGSSHSVRPSVRLS